MRWFARTIFYLSFLMIAVYIFSGVYLLLFGLFEFSKVQSLVLGLALILYGFYRLYRVIIKSRAEQKDITENE
jgi:hypothetical protein